MTLLVAVLLGLAAVAILVRVRRDAAGGMGALRGVAVGLVVLLPLGLAAAVLLQSRERLDTLRFVYAGKKLAWGPGLPFYAGGSDPDAETVEDLYAPRLGTRALTFEPADEKTAGDAVLRLRSPSPAVRLNGELVNSYPLADGDRLVLTAGESPTELTYRDGALHHGDASFELPGKVKCLVKGPAQVFYLPDLLDALVEDRSWPYLSFLHRPSATGPWHLVIRESETRVERDGGGAAFADVVPVPRDLELEMQIVWGTRIDRRSLRTVRQDRLLIRSDHVEVRFGDPQREVLSLAAETAPIELGVVVPSSIDRHERLLELDERSGRFRGVGATFRYDPGTREATIAYLNDSQTLRFGNLYAFGEGLDQMLVRLERPPFPRHLLLDLALVALFTAVFLGPALWRSAALAALVAPVGMLLAFRLLFSYRAATYPPDFYTAGYGEARLALWLVPSAILFGRTVAVLLRRAPRGEGIGALRWPLLGLVTAGLACFLLNRGAGNLPWLALLPWTAAALLYLLHRFRASPRLAERLDRWQDQGIPWKYIWLPAFAALIFAVRLLGDLLGMPETLRIPAFGFRLLWTVLQLPLCAAAFALTLHLFDERRRRLAQSHESPWPMIRDSFYGLAALGFFLLVAYAGVAAIVGDLGLLIVHALAPVAGLLLLVTWPRLPSLGAPAPRAAYGAVVLLAVLPLLFVLTANVAPGLLVELVGWGAERPQEGTETATPATQVVDLTAQLKSAKAQQLFRLYMLANPGLLSEVGLEPSERLAIHYQTLQSYARESGTAGNGFASSELPRHLGATYLSDLVPMVFVLADFGKLGVLALASLYVAVLLGAVLGGAPTGRPLEAQGAWLAALALLAFSLPSLYMVLANLNYVLFTGKNCSLLALNSVSDVLESAALLGLAAFGVGLRRDA